MFIHLDPLVFLDTQCLGQFEIRTHTRGDDDHPCRQGLASFETNAGDLILTRDLLRLRSEPEGEPHVFHDGLEPLGPIHIQLPGQKSGEKFHDRDLLVEFPKGIPGFQTQKPAADEDYIF